MIKQFKDEKLIYKLAIIVLMFATLFFVSRIAYNVIVGANYPNELLEPSNVSLTRMFMQGQSPYSLKALEYERPAINYEYPFLTSIVASLVAFVLGGNAVYAHYLISFISLIGTGVLGYLIVKPYSTSIVSPMASALLFMMCHWRFGYVSAAPDDFGLFLFVFTLYIAVSDKITRKPLACAILTTMCFYTKQYFALVFLAIFVYMLCYSKKEAFKYLLYTLLINMIIAILISVFWPLYWTYAFYFLYFGTFTGIELGITSLLNQIKYLAAIFFGMFGVLILAVIVYIRGHRRGKKDVLNVKIKENDAFSLFLIIIPVMVLPLGFLGKNDGAFLSYFLQLWMPSIIVVTIVTLERLKLGNPGIVFEAVYFVVIAITILYAYLKLPLHILTQYEIAEWESAYAIMDEYEARNDGDVYYAQQLAYRSFDNGSTLCRCGHDGEVSETTLTVWEESKIWKKLFPYVDEIINKNIEYKNSFIYKMVGGDFSLISFEEGNSLTFASFYLEDLGCYRFLTKKTLQLGNMPYEVTFYERIDDYENE